MPVVLTKEIDNYDLLMEIGKTWLKKREMLWLTEDNRVAIV